MANKVTTVKFDTLLNRAVTEVIVEQELVEMLHSGRRLRLKQGFDPSCPDIHLGHAVGLRKLRQFQELGHQVILVVGDWTAQIGDPSGESLTRPMLSPAEVKANATTYMQQFFKVVDREKTEVRWQSEWFDKFNLSDVIRLTSKFTVAQLLAREDFNRRYKTGRPLALTELLYPLLTAYDSVIVEADVEFGGIDQKFNCLMSRELQVMMGGTPEQVLLVPLLIGTDGTHKMSKSLDNYIGVDEPPKEMYGKIMSLPDNLILPYFELLTDTTEAELEEFKHKINTESINPMLLKKHLAREIVTQFHHTQAAQEAEGYFIKVFQKRDLPEEMPIFPLSFTTYRHLVESSHSQIETLQELFNNEETHQLLTQKKLFSHFHKGEEKRLSAKASEPGQILVDVIDLSLVAGLIKSRGEAKRLLKKGAIEVNGNKITETGPIAIEDGSVIRVGKRRFLRLVNIDN